MDNSSNVFEFVGISEVAETTTHLLGLALQQAGHGSAGAGMTLGEVEHYVLQQARDYVSTVREGFVPACARRTLATAPISAICLDRVLTDWDELTAIGLR